MVELQFTNPFRRDYADLPEWVRKVANRKLIIFAQSPRHPSLRLKRVAGSASLWEISVNMQYRITLEFLDETHVELRRIGTHRVLDQP